MEEELVAYMLADAGIAGLVGTRVHWEKRPQSGALPAITMTEVGTTFDYHMEGASRLRQVRLQVECWSTISALEALNVRRAVEAALSGLQTVMSGIEIQGMFIDGLNEAFESFAEGAENFFRYRVDFLVWHEEQEQVT